MTTQPQPRIKCSDVDRFADAFVDGEFAEEERAELEQHLADCAACGQKVRYQSAFKSALRKECPRPELPESLRLRIAGAVDGEQATQRRASVRRLAYVLTPVAAAATLVAVLWTSRTSPVVLDAIARHRLDLPVDVAGGRDKVSAFFNHRLNFVVRPPHMPARATLRGARMVNLRDQQAANLVYDVDGEKVSVFVFDPEDMPVQAARHRQVGAHDIYLDGQRGYNVALYRDRDVGYAFTSDMDEDRMLQLVSAAVAH